MYSQSTRGLLRLYFTVFISCLGTLQFGYHLAELNAPEAYMSCRLIKDVSNNDPRDCIPMTPTDIGIVTSIYSLGGLLAASISGSLAHSLGRKKFSLLTCVPFTVGPLLMATATTILQMQLGRFIAGLGAGAVVVVVPLYLNEISPDHLKGKLGFMSQLAINFGILLAQLLGVAFSDYGHWRKIVVFGGLVAVVNAAGLVLTPESPKWLASRGRTEEARRTLAWLRGSSQVDEELESYGMDMDKDKDPVSETTSLLSSSSSSTSSEYAPNGTVWDFLSDAKYRHMLVAVVGVMMFQQLTGVNSIVFYGVSVLADLLPTLAPVLNCIISTVVCLVTIASSQSVDKHGRKVLLILSSAGMSISSLLLAIGIINGLSVLSALAAAVFVVSFALGLGPVPFMVIPELVPHEISSAAQSVGSTVNWLSNFAVGLLFPMLEHRLHGYTYLVFTTIGLMAMAFLTLCVPETRGRKTMVEVWGRE